MGNFKIWRHIALMLAVLSFGTLLATAQSSSVVQILYPNGSGALDPTYRGNANELKKLDLIYRSLLDSMKLGHYKMSVIGYGSEDQSDVQYNALGIQRAQSLKSYLINSLGASESYFRPSAPHTSPSRFDVVFLSFTSPNAKSVEIVFIYPDGQNKPPRVIARTTATSATTTTTTTAKQPERPLVFEPQKDGVPIYNVENWHFDKPSTLTPPPPTAPELSPSPTVTTTPPPTDEYLEKITSAKPKILEDPIIGTPDRTLYQTPNAGSKIAASKANRAKPNEGTPDIKGPKTSSKPDKSVERIPSIVTSDTKVTRTQTPHNRETVMPVASLNTNLLYWAALNYNAELEFFLRKGVSLAIEGQYAYAEWGEGTKKYYISNISPEIRIWFNRDGRFTGHALGLYLQAGQYDIKFSEMGHQGDFYGAGLSYNYTLPVGYRTAFRFGIGVGYARVLGKSYHSLNLPYYTYIDDEPRNYIGPTKANISFVWRLGTKKGGWR